MLLDEEKSYEAVKKKLITLKRQKMRIFKQDFRRSKILCKAVLFDEQIKGFVLVCAPTTFEEL